MKKFIVLYHAPKDAWTSSANTSPEDKKKSMEAWMDWAKKCGTGLVDMGSPLGNAKLITKSGAAPSASTVLGYSVLQAEDMNSALALLKNHPHLEWMDACEIELHEAMPMPGM